jgi:hypothetical protein
MLLNLLDKNISFADRTRFELKRLKKYLESLDIEITQLNKKQELEILEKYLKEFYDRTDKLDKYCIIIYDLYILCIRYNPKKFNQIFNFYNEFEVLYLNHLKNLVELEYEEKLKFNSGFEGKNDVLLDKIIFSPFFNH